MSEQIETESNKRPKGSNVRLTSEAHELLAEKAKNLGDSMKEVASEAIIALFKRELKYNEYIAHIKQLNEASLKLQKRLLVYLFSSASIGTAAGIVIGLVI